MLSMVSLWFIVCRLTSSFCPLIVREKAILEQQISTLKYMKENIKDEISKHVVPDVEAELKRYVFSMEV